MRKGTNMVVRIKVSVNQNASSVLYSSPVLNGAAHPIGKILDSRDGYLSELIKFVILSASNLFYLPFVRSPVMQYWFMPFFRIMNHQPSINLPFVLP